MWLTKSKYLLEYVSTHDIKVYIIHDHHIDDGFIAIM